MSYKFRAWHEYGTSPGPPAKAGMIYDKEPGDCLHWLNQGQRIIKVMQSIGIKDKNGKEIYEGDIVRHKMPDTPQHLGTTTQGVIEYVEEVTSFRTVCMDGEKERIRKDITFEIAGNIYENPELMGD